MADTEGGPAGTVGTDRDRHAVSVTDRDRQGWSRRAVLRGAGGLATGAVATTAPGAASTPRVPTTTVVTRNLYIGVDLSRLFRADSLADVRTIAGRMLAEVDPDRYAARADAVAAEIGAVEPDVVALQEAALLRTQRPGDFGTAGADSADTVVVDLLERIRSALAARDLPYEVAVSLVTTDVELPAETPEGPADVRVTDRDALLVRDDTGVRETRTGTYDAALGLPVPGTDRDFAVRRGYCLADLTVGGARLAAVSTHLESTAPVVRRRQAAELLDVLPARGRVVLCGDFNSGPGTGTAAYDTLTGSYGDAYATLAPGDDGFTCCQAPGLRNEQSRLDERVDAVLYRGDLRPTAVGRVGHRPEDRIPYDGGGDRVRLWPSDHAGVVATFELPGPGTGSVERTPGTDGPTRTPGTGVSDAAPGGGTPEPTPEAITPGGSGSAPGPFVTLAGIGLALLARLRSS
jgi:endonuclease/exonuclease/phosphatase family metal-dependent hydrolase